MKAADKTQGEGRPVILISIKKCSGNLVKYDYGNDGERWKLDKPYRPKWLSIKFRTPSGKPKHERFEVDFTPNEILEILSKKYSNFSFQLNTNSK